MCASPRPPPRTICTKASRKQPFDHDTLAPLSSNALYRASERARAEKRALPAAALASSKRLAASSSLAFRLSQELAKAQRVNPKARISAQAKHRERVAYIPDQDRAIYVTASPPSPKKHERVTLITGEEHGRLSFLRTDHQKMIRGSWTTMASTTEMFDDTGRPVGITVTEFGVSSSTAALSPASIRAGVRDAIDRLATFVLPTVAHAAVLRDCAGEASDYFAAAAALALQLAATAQLAATCLAAPTPWCLAALQDSISDLDQALLEAADTESIYNQCMNRITNEYFIGFWGGPTMSQWCETWLILQTWDGGNTWSIIDSYEVCHGEYEE